MLSHSVHLEYSDGRPQRSHVFILGLPPRGYGAELRHNAQFYHAARMCTRRMRVPHQGLDTGNRELTRAYLPRCFTKNSAISLLASIDSGRFELYQKAWGRPS